MSKKPVKKSKTSKTSKTKNETAHTVLDENGGIAKETGIPDNTSILLNKPLSETYQEITDEKANKLEGNHKISVRENNETLPRLDPNYLQKIADEAYLTTEGVFTESLASCLGEEFQKGIVESKEHELIELIQQNPLNKLLMTKEYKRAKRDLYYDIICQIVNIRTQISEKIKTKYGEDVAKALMFRIREEIQDIWMNDDGYCYDLEEKKNELKNAKDKLKDLQYNKNDVLVNMPKVSAEDLVEKRLNTDEDLECVDTSEGLPSGVDPQEFFKNPDNRNNPDWDKEGGIRVIPCSISKKYVQQFGNNARNVRDSLGNDLANFIEKEIDKISKK